MNDSAPPDQKKGAGPKSPVQQRGLQQRDKLLRTAREVFHRLGYVDSRVADIARQAGVAHGTFYTYFDSREDALLAIATTAYQFLRSVFEGDNATPSKRLFASMPAYVDAFQEYADVISTVEQAAALHPEIKAIARQFRSFLVAQLERAIAEHLPAKSAQKSARIEAWAAYGAVDALLHAWQMEGEALTRKVVLAHIDNVLGKYLAINPSLSLLPAQRHVKPLKSRSKGAADA